MTGRKLALLLFAVAISPFAGYGQSGSTGAISGVVEDGKGAPVSSAQVEISITGSSTAMRTVSTVASGIFTVASLPVGVYDVVVKAPGFSTSKYSDVEVRVTETTRLNPSLGDLSNQASTDAGAVVQSQGVVVVSTPPVVSVETSSPTTGPKARRTRW